MKDIFRLIRSKPQELSEANRVGRRNTIIGLGMTAGVLAVGGVTAAYALHGGFEPKEPQPLSADFSGEVEDARKTLDLLDTQIQGYPDRMKANLPTILNLATAYYATQMKVDREDLRKKVLMSKTSEMSKLAAGCGVFSPSKVEYVDIVGNRVMINADVNPAAGLRARNVFSQFLADAGFADLAWKDFSGKPQRAAGTNQAIFYEKGVAAFGKALNPIGPAQAAECYTVSNNELNSAVVYDASEKLYELLGYGAVVVGKTTAAYRQYIVDGLYDGNWTVPFGFVRSGELNAFFDDVSVQLAKKNISSTAVDYIQKYVNSAA